MIDKRLFIITNRLPIHFDERGKSMPSKAGFASAIQSFLQTTEQYKIKFQEIHWVGTPGCSAETWSRASYEMPAISYNFIPVFINGKTYDSYHYKFANKVIWPLFHYLPSHADYDNEGYKHYKDVNERFLETLKKYLRKKDVIWINDYHLLPLAEMIRKQFPEITIGFFLRTPFPSYEILRLLPRKCQEEIISGILGADLIGFNTIDYATHFIQTIRTTHGLQDNINIVRHDNRLIKIDVFPISVPFQKFQEAFDKAEVKEIRDTLRLKFADRKMILSIASLDITKGIYYLLKAYEHFLVHNPSYQNQVVLVLIITPTAEENDKKERKNKIDEIISNINGKIGNINWQPVTYYYHSVSFDTVVGLYTACDLALITPLRDGMNLISKEFAASRRDKKGVLVLSELAGAAREMSGALITNPNDIEEVADRIKEALEMEESEQVKRMSTMQKRLSDYDVSTWAGDFLDQLFEIKAKQTTFQVKFFNDFTRRSVLHEYQLSERRLIVLDYDGTLVPFGNCPSDTKSEHSVLKMLHALSSNKKNDVFLTSGRSSDWLDREFATVPISLVAEYGAKIKFKDQDWVNQIDITEAWKNAVEEVMLQYTKRCPGSFIEIKDFSVVWHFRKASSEEGKLRSLEHFSELNDRINMGDLHVTMGNKTVEVRRIGMRMDNFIKNLLSKDSYHFILAIGEDRTNEDMFRILAEDSRSFTIKVGEEASYAKYNLLTQRMAISFIEHMSAL